MKEFIEKLIERLEEYPHGKYEDEYGKGFSNGINVAIKEVNELAEEYGKDTNVATKDDWIPCSERLPKESELVLIYAESTARGGSVRAVACLHNGFWFTQTSSDTLSLNGIGQYKVIAWQPLPASYKKGE